MSNASGFHLALFGDLGSARHLYFSLCLLVYVIITCANVVVVLTVCLERALHRPMYIFICYLSVNALRGSAGFFPRFLSDLASDVHVISRTSCFVQVFVLYMYATCEMSILSVMAYDRFVAVCQPLHYHRRMTGRTAAGLVALAELYPAAVCSGCLSLTVRLPLCGHTLRRFFCTNYPLVQLSCVDTTLNNVTGLLATAGTVFLPLAFVLYTYLRILMEALRSSTEQRGKALHTCLPHILTFVNYSLCFTGELLLNRLPDHQVNPYVMVVLSLEFLVIPPIVNPLVYGLKLPQIRAAIFRLLTTGRTSKNAQNHRVKPRGGTVSCK